MGDKDVIDYVNKLTDELSKVKDEHDKKFELDSD